MYVTNLLVSILYQLQLRRGERIDLHLPPCLHLLEEVGRGVPGATQADLEGAPSSWSPQNPRIQAKLDLQERGVAETSEWSA